MGGKRVNLDSKFQPKKCAKIYRGEYDWISRLPDEILVVILSSLPLKEAGRTSVLSSRWKNLWKHTLSLNFDADSVLDKIATHYKQKKLRNVERRKYINWVNRVLRFHKGLTLEEFRICFDLDISAQKAIMKWLEFAFARKVQRLELNLLEFGDFARLPGKMCVLPKEFLSRSSIGASTLQHPPDNSCKHFGFKSLKALCLRSVDVTDEAIHFLLRNCPLLEELIVHNSEKISNLEVCGSSLLLKHLEIRHCFNLKSIKLSAPNLTSLTITSVDELLLENVPKLVKVYVGCGYADIYEKRLFPALLRCISQLEFLSLSLCIPKHLIEQCKFPELPKLKTLVIEYWPEVEGDESVMELTSFMRASPYLQEFVIKINLFEFSRTDREVKKVVQFPHHHLKVVKFVGYYGCASELELVRYILENCAVLEKIIIDPHDPSCLTHTPKNRYELDEERTARIYAKQQLEAEVPQHIKLVIL